jgi:predicted MFS family arabinose efflux permease
MVLIPERVGTWTRWSVAACGMTLGASLMLVADDVVWIVGAGLVAGAFQGPLLLTIFRVVGDAADEGRAGVLLTLTTSGIVLGIAAGSALSGLLAQNLGAAAGFAPVLTATLILLAMGVVGAAATRGKARAASR